MDALTEVRLGRDKYHLQNEMIDWCRNNVGAGNWRFMSHVNGETVVDMFDDMWSIQSIFGSTVFVFKNPESATAFTLRWV